MLALHSLTFSAVSILLASRYNLAAPVHSPPHEKAGPSSSEAKQHSPEPNHHSGLEWHDSRVPTHHKLLITSTDGKFDDKLGMTANERIGGYKEHHIHHNGVLDVLGAHDHMHDWNKHMDAAGKGHFNVPQREFFHGGTPFKNSKGEMEESVHELHFRQGHGPVHDAPPLRKINLLEAGRHEDYASKHKVADFYSLGPIPEEELIHKMKAYSDVGVKIDNAVHIEGYNSRQDKQSRKNATPATVSFVRNFGNNIRKYHPKANVIMTNSKVNFGENGQGATQPYGLLAGRTPNHHLQEVGEKENFAMKQITSASDYIKEAQGNPHPFLDADGEPINQRTMWKARRNKKPDDKWTKDTRDNLVAAIDANIPLLSDANIKNRLRAVKSGIVDGCQGETCDANHIMLSHHAIKQGAKGFDPVFADDNIWLHRVEKGQEHHAITPKYSSENKRIVTEKLKDIFPIVDHEAFHEKEQHSKRDID